MRLTTKGRYAVTAMLDLALNQHVKPVSLQDIATSQEISLSYLEQLFSRLRKNKLVKGTRGPGGGYKLGRAPSAISIADIVTSVDESIDITMCAGRENCLDGERCLTHELWRADITEADATLAEIEAKVTELTDRYNTQFSAMEAAVTGFNATGEYMETLFDSWNNQNK